MGKPTTIKDIARIANVSIASVSRTINNRDKVSPEMRERIEKVIAEYDFHPNLSASNLKMRSSKLIAFMIADEINEYYYGLIEKINSSMEGSGYTLIVCNSFNDPSIEKNYLSLLSNGAVSCIILNRCEGNEDLIARLSHKIPIILLHRPLDSKDFIGDFVDADFGKATYEYTRKLLSLGHRRIGFISGSFSLGSFRGRYERFAKAMHEYGIEEDEYSTYIRTCTPSVSGGSSMVSELLSLENPPTAVIICHNLLCLGALRWLKNHNVTIPEDLSIVAPCNLNLSDLLYVSVYSAIPDLSDLGLTIADYALSRISGNVNTNRSLIQYVSLVDGESIKAI